MGGYCQFESDTVDNPLWVRVRVWNDTDTQPHEISERGVIYEIGEPVHILEIREDSEDFVPRANTIYWVGSFYYCQESPFVRLLKKELGAPSNGFVEVNPLHLRKLPDMLRIAVEAARTRA